MADVTSGQYLREGMGWSGIWLVRRQPGESDEAAIDRASGASIELRDGEPWIVPNDKAEKVAPDDDFILAAAAVARSINPDLAVTEEEREDGHLRWVTLDDGDGPVVIHLYRVRCSSSRRMAGQIRRTLMGQAST